MTKHRRKPKHIHRWLLAVVLLPASVFPVHAQSSAAPQSSHPSSPERTPEASPQTSAEEVRQAQIEEDTKKLYQLSAELRAEVAKTYKESLSLAVLKKAEEVEKLARSLKILMNQEAAASRK